MANEPVPGKCVDIESPQPPYDPAPSPYDGFQGNGPVSSNIAYLIVSRATLEIVVAGGTGTSTFTGVGEIVAISFIPPGGDVYAFEIKDDGEFGVAGFSKLRNKSTVGIARLAIGVQTLTITGTDGTYKVRVWVKGGL